MSIRPIDVITMAPKSQEVSHIQHAEQAKATHAQEQIGVIYEKESRQQSEQINQTDSAEKKREFDARNSSGNNAGAFSQQHKKKKDEKEKEKAPEIKQGSFDIKI
ncbi:MAG: hypothetical protein K6G65_08595 [Lachnospiraceae bacterium]|nr:hypothetical protein [Lachnospiraceae bacterium]